MKTVPSRWALANGKTDNAWEVQLRAELHPPSLRFRKNVLLRFPELAVRPDVVFTRARVAVSLERCFCHSCPEHSGNSLSNNASWRSKVQRKRRRDDPVRRRLTQGDGES